MISMAPEKGFKSAYEIGGNPYAEAFFLSGKYTGSG